MRRSAIFLHRGDRALWLVQLLLGTAVGATTAAFVLIDAVIWRPVEARELDRIVAIGGLATHRSLGDPVAWWSKVEGFEYLARYRTGDVVTDAAGGKRWVRVTEVSASFDEIFGNRFKMGRGCSLNDEALSSGLAVVSRSFWEGWLRRDPNVIGRHIQLGDVTASIIGVVDGGFSFPSSTDVWTCRRKAGEIYFDLVSGAESLPPVRNTEGWVALLRKGVSIEQARAQTLALLKFTNAQLSPKSGVMYGEVVSITPLRVVLSRNAASTLYVFVGACGCLLLLALLNSTFHFLAVVIRRRTDFEIRRAIGASAFQAAWPVIELAAIGGVLCGLAGIVTGSVCLSVARYFLFAFRVHIAPISELWLLLGATSTVLGTVVGLISGIIPAVIASSSNPVALVRRQSGASSALERTLRRALVVTQLGVATVLVIGGITVSRSYFGQLNAARGYSTDNVVVLSVVIPKNSEGTLSARYVLDAARSAPGVRSVAVASSVLVSSRQRTFLAVMTDEEPVMVASVDYAGDYFETLGVEADIVRDTMEPRAIVINSKLASKLWPEAVAIGKELSIGGEATPRVVRGVSSNTQAYNEAEPPFELFRPITTLTDVNPSVLRFRILVRTDRVTPAFVQELLSALPSDLGSSVLRTDVLSDAIRREMAPQRAQTVVWLIYAALGLLVSLAGVSGLVVYLVGQRRFEAGIRAACGATPRSLVLLMSKEGLVCVFAGVGIGLLASLVVSKLARSLLVGLQSPGLGTVLLAAFLILLVGSAAATIPAIKLGRNATGFLRT